MGAFCGYSEPEPPAALAAFALQRRSSPLTPLLDFGSDVRVISRTAVTPAALLCTLQCFLGIPGEQSLLTTSPKMCYKAGAWFDRDQHEAPSGLVGYATLTLHSSFATRLGLPKIHNSALSNLRD